MAIPKIVGAQRDFSGGELDEAMKRADENPILRTGARQMSNWRILSSRAAANRLGSTALFGEFGRVEKVTMKPGEQFYLTLGAGYIQVHNVVGFGVFFSTTLGDGVTTVPFTGDTLQQITYAIVGLQIYIFYAQNAPNNVPQILTWDGISQTSSWTLTTFAESVTTGSQKLTAFYRISPQGIIMYPSATQGSINVAFSAPVLTAGSVGTRMTYAGRQLTITSVTDSNHGTALVNEPLPPAQQLTLSSPVGAFNIGDEVNGSISGAVGIVTASPSVQYFLGTAVSGSINVGDSVVGGTSGATGIITWINPGPEITVQLSTTTVFSVPETVTDTTTGATFTTANPASGAALIVQILPTSANYIQLFKTTDTIVGPSGSAGISAIITEPPQGIAVWADEVMNTYRGYPSSVFYDQGRLGLCNFPAVPSGVAWSAIGLTLDFYVNAEATNVLPSSAIFEIAPGKSQVLYISAGMESSEFVFCDNAIYYIPIGTGGVAALEPGSVSFNALASFGIMPNVQPRRSEQSIVFVKAGGGVVGAVQAPGAYYRPYIVDSISELHQHLFTGAAPIAIAIPTAAVLFEELYLYVLLDDGSLVVGKYAMRQGLIEPGVEGKPHVGWTPWSSAASITWIAANQDEVTLTSIYNGAGVVSKFDLTQFLDSAYFVNNIPGSPFDTGAGLSLLNLFGASTTVFLIDLGTRFMGTYQLDNAGYIIPQFAAGEDLSSPQLIAGQPWTSTLEVFAPDATAPGQSMKQRMIQRRVARMSVYVSNSTGFLFARLYAGPLGSQLPALGTIMNTRRVTTWNQDDDPTQPPPLREEVQRWRPLGRSFDPRVCVIKDTPGSVLVHEIDMEVTI
jgi:hypothetical protein